MYPFQIPRTMPRAMPRAIQSGHYGRRNPYARMRSGQDYGAAVPGFGNGYPPGCDQHTSLQGLLKNCPPYTGPQCRTYSLGFASAGVVLAGATVSIIANPQGAFVGKRLVIPSTLGPSFTLNNIIVANRPQNVAQGAVSAVVFSEVAVGVTLALDPAQPGVQIELQVTNTSAADLAFSAVLIGDALA